MLKLLDNMDSFSNVLVFLFLLLYNLEIHEFKYDKAIFSSTFWNKLEMGKRKKILFCLFSKFLYSRKIKELKSGRGILKAYFAQNQAK